MPLFPPPFSSLPNLRRHRLPRLRSRAHKHTGVAYGSPPRDVPATFRAFRARRLPRYPLPVHQVQPPSQVSNRLNPPLPYPYFCFCFARTAPAAGRPARTHTTMNIYIYCIVSDYFRFSLCYVARGWGTTLQHYTTHFAASRTPKKTIRQFLFSAPKKDKIYAVEAHAHNVCTYVCSIPSLCSGAPHGASRLVPLRDGSCGTRWA